MLDTIDAQNLYENLPDLEVVSFYSRIAPGSSTSFSANSPYTLYYAKRFEQARDNISPGALRHATLTWLLQALDLANAGAPNPKVDDVLQDQAGVRWTFKKVTLDPLSVQWSCEAIKELPVNANIN